MEQILNFNAPLDVDLLDRITYTLNNGSPAEMKAAEQILNQFKENDAAWLKVGQILEYTQSQYTKFFALQVLEPVIKYRWRALPRDQCDGIKNYIVDKVIALSSNEEIMRQEKLFREKLNVVLVQIIKQEWPHNWDSFVQEITTASRTNETLCENNMIILKLLSQEVFDFSVGEMTQAKIQELKQSFENQFLIIYQLCEFVLVQSNKPSLLIATLETLHCFLTWIPIGYIFEYNMINVLINKLLPVPIFRNPTIKCLIEIGCLPIDNALDVQFAEFLALFMQCLSNFLPRDTDIASAVENGDGDDLDFVENLALFFTGFFKAHIAALESPKYYGVLLLAHEYLANISLVDEDEVFKICLEYWGALAYNLFYEVQFPISSSPLMLTTGVGNDAPRRQLYSPILVKVRIAVIQRMARPEEVLVTEDENGNLIRQHLKDTDSINLYENMRDTLVYLTHLDTIDTVRIMERKLEQQRLLVEDGAYKDEWWNNLNRLCWAIGSISGVQTEEGEKKFLVQVIKHLLSMCEVAVGKDNKAVIATNIMYIVGQYPRFLKAHWKFLRTVVMKLFEFMLEKHPGVQDMACDTFLKISKSCRKKFVVIQLGESRPFIVDLLTRLPDTIRLLEPQQVQTFYESVGYMISASSTREGLIEQLMLLPNTRWREIMTEAGMNVELLKQLEVAKMLTNILKTNVHVATSLGPSYVIQLSSFFGDLLQVYKFYSDAISQAVAIEGSKATRTAVVRGWRSVKQETLRLLSVFVQKSKDTTMLEQRFIPLMLDAVLSDYNTNIPESRDAEVLALMTTIINQLKEQMIPQVPRIFDAIFECTLLMIRENFNDFPEVRVQFFNFLQAIISHCFRALFLLPERYVGAIIDSIVWAFKHTRRDISDTGLEILRDLWKSIANSDAAGPFFQTYVTRLLDELLYVLVDGFHKSGFKMQATMLMMIFEAVTNENIRVPLYDPTKLNFPNNKVFLRDFVVNLIGNAFANLTPAQVVQFVDGLFELCVGPVGPFKNHLRDFLVQTKEFGSVDNSELYLEERENERAAERARRELVPGLIKPITLEQDSMMD